jgi:hypothetical protein
MANVAIIPPKSKQIGDCTYSVEPLGARSGRSVFVRLCNMLAPGISALDPTSAITELAGKSEPGTKVGLESFMAGLGKMLGSLKDADLEYLEGQFAGRTTVSLPDGKAPVLAHILDGHFTGPRFKDYFLWLYFCLEATYGDFFGEAWNMATAKAAKQVQAAVETKDQQSS